MGIQVLVYECIKNKFQLEFKPRGPVAYCDYLLDDTCEINCQHPVTRYKLNFNVSNTGIQIQLIHPSDL